MLPRGAARLRLRHAGGLTVRRMQRAWQMHSAPPRRAHQSDVSVLVDANSGNVESLSRHKGNIAMLEFRLQGSQDGVDGPWMCHRGAVADL